MSIDIITNSDRWTPEQIETFRKTWDALLLPSRGAVTSIVIPERTLQLANENGLIDTIEVEVEREGKRYKGIIPYVGEVE